MFEWHLVDSALHVSNFYSWFEFKDSCIECWTVDGVLY
jgi:hypothetical protein